MPLAVKKFFQTMPQLPFRFVVDIIDENGIQEKLKYAIRSVKFTDADGDTSAGAVFYGGGGYFTIPIWDLSARGLNISFEETDKMDVTKYIDKLAGVVNKGMNQYSFSGTPKVIAIVVREYDNMMYKVLRGRCFWCMLQDYDDGQFSRTGGVSAVQLSMQFVVRTISENFDVDDAVLSRTAGTIASGLNVINTPEQERTDQMEKLINLANKVQYDGEMHLEGLVNADIYGTKGVNTRHGAAEGTKDFNVTEEESEALHNKIYRTTGKNVNRQDLDRVLKDNAERMDVSLFNLRNELRKKGVTVEVNAYNDTGHEVGLGTNSGSHTLGQKIDLTFLDKNGKKMTMQNMSDDQRKIIEDAANKSGLVSNWEANGDPSTSTWGDFSLKKASSIGKNGEYIAEQEMTRWTKKGGYYNSATKQHEQIR